MPWWVEKLPPPAFLLPEGRNPKVKGRIWVSILQALLCKSFAFAALNTPAPTCSIDLGPTDFIMTSRGCTGVRLRRCEGIQSTGSG